MPSFPKPISKPSLNDSAITRNFTTFAIHKK